MRCNSWLHVFKHAVDIILNMVTEEQQFRADTLRILGVACITPIARFLLDPGLFFMEHDLIYSIIYIPCAILAALFGLTQIEIARGILDERGKDKWKQIK